MTEAVVNIFVVASFDHNWRQQERERERERERESNVADDVTDAGHITVRLPREASSQPQPIFKLAFPGLFLFIFVFSTNS